MAIWMPILLTGGQPDEIWFNNGHGEFFNSGFSLNSDATFDLHLADIDNDNDLDVIEVDNSKIIIRENIVFNCNYLNETPPINEPLLFGENILLTNNKLEHTVTFSPEGTEIFFTREPTTYVTKYSNGIWSTPQESFFTGREAIISSDGSNLYFNDEDLWYIPWTVDDWGEAVKFSEPVSSSLKDYYMSSTRNGTIYFSRYTSNDGAIILKSEKKNGVYETIDTLPFPVNSGIDYHPFIAPDESYLLFNSNREGGYGAQELYISFKNDDGSWTNPQNLGANINTDLGEVCPTVTPDGKYMFFTRNNNGAGEKWTGDIYWVSTSFIDSLKQHAHNPTLIKCMQVNNQKKIEVFPNPAQHIIKIKINDFGSEIPNYQIINLNGKIIKQGKLDFETINISGLKNGIYLLRIKTSEEFISKKIVIY